MESRQIPWALFLMLYPCPGHTCRYQMICLLSLVQSMRTRSLLFLFSVEGLGCQWMSQRPRPRVPLRTPTNMTPMLELCHAHMGVFTEALLDEEVGRIALSCHLAPDIPCDKDEVHRLEDHTNRHYSRSGIMLVSSVCGHELYFWCALCNSGESATQWTKSLVALSNSVHDVYVCNFLLDDLVISSGIEPDVNNVARGPNQQRSLDCLAMIDGSRMFPRSVFQADTIFVSCRLANFERISWSMQRCHKIWGLGGEPATKADYDKFLESFEDNDPGACDGRSV